MGNNNGMINPAIFEAIYKLNIIEFLDDYNISYTLEGKNIGTNFIGISPCPNCGDIRNHYAIHKIKKYSSCFKCGCYYSPIKTLSILSNQSTKKIINLLSDSLYNENVDLITRIKFTLKNTWKPSINHGQIIDILPKGASKLTDISGNLKPLFFEKHIRKEHIQKYNLHSINNSTFKNYILWPIYFKNKLVSWQMRSTKTKRYHSSKTIAKYIYNYDNAVNKNTIIIVEGFFDLLRLETYVNKKNLKNIAIISGLIKRISTHQIQHIINLNPERLIVLFDRDSWFDYYKIQNQLNSNVEFEILPKGKDPNMLTWKEMGELFKRII